MTISVSKELIDAYIRKNEGILHPRLLDEHIASLSEEVAAYPAQLSVISFVVYSKFEIQLLGKGMTFYGHSGGFALPGGNISAGDVRAKDLQRVLKETTEFGYISLGAYLHLDFYDKRHSHLGSFDGGGVGSPGGGAGTGKWYSNVQMTHASAESTLA